MESYSTPDLYLAAFLITAGHKMSRTSIQGKRLIFHFENDGSSELEELENAYFKADERVKVMPLYYSNNIKSLKTLCHSVLKRNE